MIDRTKYLYKKKGVMCTSCKERLFSWHVHDFHYCRCGKAFIDGGNDYARCGGKVSPKFIIFSKRDL